MHLKVGQKFEVSYVFWNIWDYVFWRDQAMIGIAAHLTGGAMGLILGITLFRKKRHWAAEQIRLDELALKDDESGLSKFSAIDAMPAG